MPVEAAVISYVLSSVASVGRIMESVITLSKEGKKLSQTEFESIVAQGRNNNKIPTGAMPQDNKIYVTMTKQVVDDLEQNMSNILEQMRKIVNDPTMEAGERVREMLKSQKNYCAALKMIKMFNGGQLPPHLQVEWENNECGKFSL